MVPFPALARDADGGARARIELVVCRFAPDTTLRVRAEGPGWDEEPGALALAALAEALSALDLSLTRTSTDPAEIEIQTVEGLEAEAPEGLGDTLVECDVERAAEATGEGAVRGIVSRAEIRMRRSGFDATGRLRRASDEEWTGALLHELGHALGFSGHAAMGSSLLVRDQGLLRKLGRAVLRGDAISDPTLTALYHLDPGQRLGERALSRAGVKWAEAILALDRRNAAAGNRRISLLASTGDREARLSFRYADGTRLGLRFPGWAAGLRRGDALIIALPDRATIEAIRAVSP